jgi:putative tryptophan/tyrosine transport system substrate-binding protein
MRRRDFIAGLGGAAAWTVAARAQQAAMPVVGFLYTQSPGPSADFVAAFRQGLSEAGFVEGGNVAIEYRWAENRYDRLPGLAAELVKRKVAIIFAGGGESAIAAASETATIPIVFTMGDLDPVRAGLVASLRRPGGNVTGAIPMMSVTGTRRLGLLHELVPNDAVVAMLSNPTHTDAADQVRDIQEAARTLGKQILVLNASNESDIDASFAILVRQRAGALVLAADPFFTERQPQIIVLAARHALPVCGALRSFAVAGGLMSYGPNILDSFRQAGNYTARVLKGEKAADLPVVQSTRFDFVINLKTARALGLTIPETLLATADEVIQ